MHKPNAIFSPSLNERKEKRRERHKQHKPHSSDNETKPKSDFRSMSYFRSIGYFGSIWKCKDANRYKQIYSRYLGSDCCPVTSGSGLLVEHMGLGLEFSL